MGLFPLKDNSTAVEVIVALGILSVCYIAAAFITLDILWFNEVTPLFRGVFLLIWSGISLGIIYKIET